MTQSKHRDVLSLRIKGSLPRDPTTEPSWIARGLHPSGALACTLRLRHWAEPEHARRLCLGLGGSPAPRLLNEGSMDPILSSFPAFGSSKGLGSRQTPEPPRLRAPQHCPAGAALSIAPQKGSRTGRDARSQTPPLASGAPGLPGLRVGPPNQLSSLPRSL